MLSAEEARAGLEVLADPGWVEASRDRIGGLRRGLRPTAEVLLPIGAAGDADWDEQARRRTWAAATTLDNLPAAESRLVFEAVHPALGSALAVWWKGAVAQPFQRGWDRRGFRAPTLPWMTRRSRIDTLRRIVAVVGPHDQAPEWFASWAPFLRGRDRALVDLGPVLAAAIDGEGDGGDAVFRTLIESGNGHHPIGGMGRHVIVGLLGASRPAGWDYIGSMLVAAQRQEGLRQAILEAADEAVPEAFDRLIDVVLGHDLLRFPATVRALSVWLGLPPDGERLDRAEARLRQLRSYRADRGLAASRVVGGDPWDTYVGLCALAQYDVVGALSLARVAARLPDPGNRAAVVRFLTNVRATQVVPLYVDLLADPDLRVAVLAQAALAETDWISHEVDGYAALAALLDRLPAEPETVDPVGIDTEPLVLDRRRVAAALVTWARPGRLEPLLDLLPVLTPDARLALLGRIEAEPGPGPELRRCVVDLVGDRSVRVRARAAAVLAGAELSADAPQLERLLSRRPTDLRRAVLLLLASQQPAEVAASARRLWAGDQPRRDAACELLTMTEPTGQVRDAAAELAATGATPAQERHLAVVRGELVPVGDSLGLYQPADLTPPRVPDAGIGARAVDEVGFVIADSIDDLIDRHRNAPVPVGPPGATTEILLGDLGGGLAGPFDPVVPSGADLVLRPVFEAWWRDRPEECRGGGDGLDVLDALVVAQLADGVAVAGTDGVGGLTGLLRPLAGVGTLRLRHPHLVVHVLEWLLVGHGEEVIDSCIEATEAVLAALGPDHGDRLAAAAGELPWMRLAGALLLRDRSLATPDRVGRWYGLLRWVADATSARTDHPLDPAQLIVAHGAGVASDADVLDGLLRSGRGDDGGYLRRFTLRRRSHLVERYPAVVALADRVRDRVVELELARGDLPTPGSAVAHRLGSIEGAEAAIRLLAGLGRSSLVRHDPTGDRGRDAVYSRLIQISHPAPGDSAAVVGELAARHGVGERRLAELAMYAPQWAPVVEGAIGWDGLEDAVWWFHCHTKDERWAVEPEVRETWAARSAERTSLSAVDLTDGAVDVEWFTRARQTLGAARWTVLQRLAKLASGGAGHRRAQVFADAMSGRLDEAELVGRLRSERHQDSARALGLLPLPVGWADAAALGRYQELRRFELEARQFGPLRQRSEQTAVRIGIENLARTAGAAEPQRFVWAMEVAEGADLARGPVSVTVQGVAVTLSVDPEGASVVTVERDGRPLKAIPAGLRRDPTIAALTARRTALIRQTRRVRRTLEQAMVAGDLFTPGDLLALDDHPVVRPLLELVVWVDELGGTFRRRGERWVDAQGAIVPPAGMVRVAHPVDLLRGEDWIPWQEQLFDDAERQPFKQAFRELYVLTPAEMDDSPMSRRWAGHQVQPRQARALFVSRGWVPDWESGEVSRVFHSAGLVVRVRFDDIWGTPAELVSPTLGEVSFTGRIDGDPVALHLVPPVVFSEAMRDLDLVVSVAHAGGVDPEATASTVEMRAALVRETVRLMGYGNVRLHGSHVVIEGALGEYSVHLGSGTVHRRPGGALCIIPVDAQHRGRVFLPFADDDPKTAEVVSKILLLARDATITDPTILDQLRS